MATVTRARFNWEEAVKQDRDLKRIDAFVKLTVSKCPGQLPPRADASRGGSRYEPAADPVVIKAEHHPISGTTSIAPSSTGSVPFAPQFIDPRDYQSESSSEMDTREVNPMDELSDFESETPRRQTVLEQVQPMDVEMAAQDEEKMDDQAKLTVCEICRNSDQENAIILCDDCDAEFHISCLDPPLLEVPDGTWNHRQQLLLMMKAVQALPVILRSLSPPASVDTRATTTISSSGQADGGGNVLLDGTGGNSDPASIHIAQALEEDPRKSNALLIHACNCDEVRCSDPELNDFCPHMKRFLRSVCWASHSDKWRSYRLARITAELFAYHAMNCDLLQCNVPLCVKIREEEIV
uniref:Zinc finger PHD-type domain-containing protein n=1 Tax=Peronospora matthiolae TaxID=2874970 RepID=A0AAV1UAW4_9STRA